LERILEAAASIRITLCRSKVYCRFFPPLCHDAAGSSFSRSERFHLCQFESALVAWSFVVAFQRKKAAAIGAKAFPGFVEPALATSIEKVPSGDRWIHEIKFDGYRVQLQIHNDAIKVLTRRGKDVV
jgi:ATP-dependent DNA ligase